MSKAEELLSSLETSQAVALLIDSSEEPHIIIGADRYITVPDELKRLAVQYDHNIETVTFDCPRYWDEHDMSQMGVYINYELSNKTSGIYKAKNVRVDDADPTIMHFEWTINSDVTPVSGKIAFLVCVKNVNEYDIETNHWNTERCTDCYISEGMEPDAIVFDPDKQYIKILEDFVHIGADEPPSVPVLWIDPNGEVNQVSEPSTSSSGPAKVNAYADVLEDFIYIGTSVPSSLPTLWMYPYDTSVSDDDHMKLGIVGITITEV